MMSLIKHQQADISAQGNISMTKSIKEYLRSWYHNTFEELDPREQRFSIDQVH